MIRFGFGGSICQEQCMPSDEAFPQLITHYLIHSSFPVEQYNVIVHDCPFLYAILKGKFEVAEMLYEGSACSNKYLFLSFESIRKLFDPESNESKQVSDALQNSDKFKHLREYLPRWRHIGTNSRSLKSMCRIAIGRSISEHRHRHKHIDLLPLPNSLKNYLLFSEFTYP